MDHESLRTAATYLNNLLLARGLLRNGEPIDFVKPSKDSRAQIINLVHDLVLREDREKDQRERSAEVLRMLRAEDARKTHEIERLTSKCEENARATAQAQTAERTAQAEVKKLEKAIKTLQDQATKFKVSLAQVKTQCTNDVRKRDLELARLKQHLQGQQRGNKVGLTAPTLHVRQTSEKRSHVAHDLRDPEYSLKQETTEFLTQLSQSLSDENDGLITLLRESVGTLKELLGLPAHTHKHPDSAIGSLGSDHEPAGRTRSANGNSGIVMLQALPTSYEAISADLAMTLAQLRNVLTNPNFVSVEEVEVREEEIGRLRQGWERMEQRWRDVLVMMEGWIRRMNTGETINIDDLRRGIGMVSPDRIRLGDHITTQQQDVSLIDSEVSEIRMADDSLLEDSMVAAAPEPPAHAQPLLTRKTTSTAPKRKHDALEPPEFFDLRPSISGARSMPSSPTSPRRLDALAALLEEEDDEESEDLEAPQMTIEEKLTAAQEEAEQAVREQTQRPTTTSQTATTTSGSDSKIPRRSQMISRGPGSNGSASQTNGAGSRSGTSAKSSMNLHSTIQVEDDTLGRMPSPMAKRTKIRGRPRKRKSTLSPEELEVLMSVNADAA